MAKTDLHTVQPHRILLIKPSSLGDVVDALPVAAGLRVRFPEAHVAWLAKTAYAPLVACSPDVDEVVPLSADGGFGSRWRGLRRAVRAVRAGAFDLALDLQGLFRSGYLGWSGRAPIRVGLSSAREGAGLFYTDTVTVPTMEMHAVDRYWLAAAALGCSGRPPTVRLRLPDEACRRIDALLGAGDREAPLAVLLPGARWQTKCWPADRFGPVADRLIERAGARIVVAGSDAEVGAARTIAAAARGAVLDATGATDVVELAALLARADVVVSVDTGPMHLAAALGRPVVAVFGPTNPVRTGPYGAGHRVVTARLECQPCYRRRCSDVRCLDAVGADEVGAAALAALECSE